MRRYFTILCAAGALASGQLTAAPRDPASAGWYPRDVAFPGVIRLDVDATDVERGIFRVYEVVPVPAAGRFTLLYPTWVNGHHAPTAPIDRIVGLVIRGRGRTLAWTRDPLDMHAFHVVVPKGFRSLTVEFQYLSATDPSESGAVGVVTTPDMLNLQWFATTLYPAGFYARRIAVDATVTLPSGWASTSQLPVAAQAGDRVHFQRTDLDDLLDSPVMAGRYVRRYDLGSIHGAPVVLDALADAPQFLDAQPQAIAAHRRLVEQTARVFGRAPFERYTFMVALSKELGDVGTEHLASSENRRAPDYLTAWQGGTLLPHELVHSWNGKARRPVGSWTPDFNQPLRNSMLWLYEGQAQFWAYVLATRSGMMPREQAIDLYGRLAAQQMRQPGRSWRPLADTGNDLIITRYQTGEPWISWHRTNRDSYTEGNLVWIEVDGILRERSGGRRSMDDFARTFFQGGGKLPSLYTLRDVIEALSRIQPYDWGAFFRSRVESTSPNAGSDWLRRSGYRLVFTDTLTAEAAASEKRANRVELSDSLGLVLRGGDSGSVVDVLWDGPAFRAGLAPGARILKVNGGKYDPKLLKAAIQNNRAGGSPLALRVINRSREKTLTIDYRGGLRFPRLERLDGMPDRLGDLLRAKT